MKKISRSRFFSFPLWAGLLILGSPVPLLADADEHTDLSVKVLDQDLISLSAYRAPVQDVLQEIARSANLKIIQYVGLKRLVTLSLDQQPLSVILSHILEDDSYQLYESQQSSADVLWIFSKGSSLAPAATISLEGLLLQGNVSERKEAIGELQQLGSPDAVRSISLALGDENLNVRNLAFDALASIGGEEALAAIASASLDQDPTARGESALALASGHNESAVQYLSIAYKDSNPNVRRLAVEAFADIPSEKSVQALGLALRDENPAVRMQAVDALEHIGGDAALQALVNMSPDSDPGVQDAVSDALLLLDRRQQ